MSDGRHSNPAEPSSMRIAIGYNTSRYAYHFRRNLIQSLIKEGHHVYVFAPTDEYSEKLTSIGATHVHISMHPGLSFISDARTFFGFLKPMIALRISCYLGYTIKPNVLGVLAANMVGAKIICNIAGLGHAFAKKSKFQWIATKLYKLSLSKASVVFFQNDEDLMEFKMARVVSEQQCRRIPGSGVDLSYYKPVDPRVVSNTECKPFVFLMFSRLIWSKGINEYFGASRLVGEIRPDVVFVLIGHASKDGRDSVPIDTINDWTSAEGCEFIPGVDDVRAHIARADCVVLPSFYREGVPRSLLESAAMAKPIITTNSVGCRDAIVDGVSGLLVEPHSVQDLAEKMLEMINFTSDQRELMGRKGRAYMESNFDENIVLQSYLTAIRA